MIKTSMNRFCRGLILTMISLNGASAFAGGNIPAEMETQTAGNWRQSPAESGTYRQSIHDQWNLIAGIGFDKAIAVKERAQWMRPDAIQSGQTVYGIMENGDLGYYDFQGMNSGNPKWGRINKGIGTGWNFRQVFSGGEGVIFAVADNGDLMYYRYLGMNTGDNRWGPVGKKIGTGWNFAHVFAELRPVDVPGPETPIHDVLPPDDDPRCEGYARSAVEQYRLTLNNPKCRVNPDPRWQADYRAHYGWCMSNPGEEALENENKLRVDHLVRCGATHRMAEPVGIPSD
jgi:hypothetical protein